MTGIDLLRDPLRNKFRSKAPRRWRRRGTASSSGAAERQSGAHQNILLEARFDVPAFAARVMVDAARRLPVLGPGAHRYSLRGKLEGDFRGQD